MMVYDNNNEMTAMKKEKELISYKTLTSLYS